MSRKQIIQLALFYTGVVIYGSLVPLNFQSIPFDAAVSRFKDIPYLALGVGSRADWVSNILLFIPLGFVWMGVLTVDSKSRGWKLCCLCLLPVILAGLSVAIEFTQLWFPPRTVSLNDIVAESIGGLGGCLIWLIFGQGVTDWVRDWSADRNSKSKLERILVFYAVGYIIYNVMPLDVTISVRELADKYLAGRIILIPFSGTQFDMPFLYRAFKTIVLLIPVGMLAAVWRVKKPFTHRTLGTCLVYSLVLVFLIELVQIFIYTRFADMTDVIIGIAGAGIGSYIIIAFREKTAGAGAVSHNKQTDHSNRFLLLLGICMAYSFFLLLVFTWPWDFISDTQTIKNRYLGFFRTPFEAMYYGTEFNALSVIVKNVLFFGPLGAVFALAAVRLKETSAAIRRLFIVFSLLWCFGIAMAIEILQILLPSRVPDITDIFIMGTASAAGLFITLHSIGQKPA